jgi:TolA-binding protein
VSSPLRAWPVICLLLVGSWPCWAVAQTVDEAAALAAAEDAYADRAWPVAAEAFEAFVATYPESDQLNRAYLRLAQAYGQTAQDQLARQTYSKLLALDPDDSYANQAVASWGSLYVRRYQYREAAQMCEEVMRMYAGTRAGEVAHYYIGNYLYGDKRYDDAIRAYTTFLEAYPTSVYQRSGLRQLVDILLRESRTDQAEEVLQQYVTASPDDSLVLGQLAEVYAGQERFEDAVRMLEQALERKPGDTQLLESLGTAHVQGGDRDGARDAWLRIVATGKQTYSTHQRVAHLLKQHGFYEDAATHYSAAIALQPRVAYLYTQLADIHKIQGDTAGALTVFVKSLLTLGMAPAARAPVLTAIAELYPAKDAARAYDDMGAVVRREAGGTDVTAPTALLTLAEARFMARDYDGSLVWFERLAATASDDGVAMALYARNLEDRRDNAAAEKFYAALLRAHPQGKGVAAWWLSRGRAVERLGNHHDAVSHYRAAIAADPARMQASTSDVALATALMRGTHEPAVALAHLSEVRTHPRLTGLRLHFDVLIAEAHMLMGSYEQAESVLTRGSWGRGETAARARYVLGELYLMQGRYEQASEAYMLVARTYGASAWANDAIDRMTLIQANKGHGSALDAYVAAVSLRASGDAPGAMRECRAVADTAPSAPVAQDALMLLAEIAAETGDLEVASTSYGTLSRAEGHLADRALLQLGRMRATRADDGGATAAYEQLLLRSPTGAFAVTARAELRALLDAPASP